LSGSYKCLINLYEIWKVNQFNIGRKIRRARQALDLSQECVAEDLGITKGAFSKIERGLTNVPVTRLIEIAGVLKVDVAEFFESSSTTKAKAEDPTKQYGFATKSEIEELANMIEALRVEITALKSEVKSNKKGKK
jgi:transcriptional regulator with XRE-family HTH domain